MPCGCKQIRRVIEMIPGGKRLVDKFPPLPEHVDVGVVNNLPRTAYSSTDNRPFKSEVCRYDEVLLRQKVVEEALSWKGTPYHHEARVKGHGVDCGQFPLAVYEACGCIRHVSVPHYPPDFHSHNTHEWYAEIVGELADEFLGPPFPGDFVLFKIKDALVYSHGGIVTDWPWIMHASAPQRKVWPTRADMGWLAQLPRRFFKPKAFSRVSEGFDALP